MMHEPFGLDTWPATPLTTGAAVDYLADGFTASGVPMDRWHEAAGPMVGLLVLARAVTTEQARDVLSALMMFGCANDNQGPGGSA